MHEAHSYNPHWHPPISHSRSRISYPLIENLLLPIANLIYPIERGRGGGGEERKRISQSLWRISENSYSLWGISYYLQKEDEEAMEGEGCGSLMSYRESRTPYRRSPIPYTLKGSSPTVQKQLASTLTDRRIGILRPKKKNNWPLFWQTSTFASSDISFPIENRVPPT